MNRNKTKNNKQNRIIDCDVYSDFNVELLLYNLKFH